MAKSEIIKTKRLIIEPFSEKYITERYLSWLNNPEIVRYSEQRHRRHTRESCREYLSSFNATPHYFWAISVLNSNLGYIGTMNAYIDKVNKTAGLGILIGEIKAWGKGYGREAWQGVCSYLFKKVKIRKITAGTLASNRRMLRLMKRAGMARDGWRSRQCIWEGKEVDVIYAALFNNKLKKQ